MNKQDVIDVLTAVRAFDNRTVGQGDVEAWYLVIGDLPKDLALRAAIDHRKNSPGVWLEPGHISQLVHGYMRDDANRDEYPINMVTAADARIGIDERVLSTGRKLYRFFYEDDRTSTCGRWRDTLAEAQRDGDDFEAAA